MEGESFFQASKCIQFKADLEFKVSAICLALPLQKQMFTLERGKKIIIAFFVPSL